MEKSNRLTGAFQSAVIAGLAFLIPVCVVAGRHVFGLIEFLAIPLGLSGLLAGILGFASGRSELGHSALCGTFVGLSTFSTLLLLVMGGL